MKKKLRASSCFMYGLVLCPALLSSAAWAGPTGQTITISELVSHDVYGNGDQTDNGSWNSGNIADLKGPNGNTVKIETNGWVQIDMSVYYVGDVYGGRGAATDEQPQATVKDNIVTISGNGIVERYVYGGRADDATDYDISASLTVSHNSVTIGDDATVGSNVFGGSAFSSLLAPATASDNSVTINGKATVGGSVFGGEVEKYGIGSSATANGNSVTIDGDAAVDGPVTGGQVVNYASLSSDPTTATGNRVTIGGKATVGAYVFGGSALSYDSHPTAADSNHVTIGDYATVGGSVYGGYAEVSSYDLDPVTVTADSNTVTIGGNASVFTGYGDLSVYGGKALDYYGDNSAQANGNTVAIGGNASVSTEDMLGDVYVYGGYAQANASAATANGNSVIIDGDASVSTEYGDAAVYGGKANNNYWNFSSPAAATASDNSVTIGGNATVGAHVFGGSAQTSNPGSSTADSNRVTIDGDATVGGDVYGGSASNSDYVWFDSYPSITITAKSNSVTIDGNAVVGGDVYNKNIYGGYAYSVSGPVTASDNSVTIGGSASVFTEYGNVYVYGGKALSNSYPGDYSAQANDNIVAIGGNASVSTEDVDGNVYVYGGYASNYGQGSATASENSVTIDGGATVAGDVYGGYAEAAADAAATGNKVSIGDSATVNGSVYGGYIFLNSDTATATATDNSVTISGAPNLSAANLYGGFVGRYARDEYGDLIFDEDWSYIIIIPAPNGDAFTGNTLNVWNYSGSPVASVQNFEHYNFILPATLSGPALSVTGTATLGNGVTGSTVTAIGLGDNQTIAPGDTVRLIQAGILTLNGFSQSQIQGTDSAGLTTAWKLTTDATSLTDGSYLDAFLKSLSTEGDLERPSGYTVHSSANESVSLSVGGTLTVAGAGLIVDNSAGGGVSVDIGAMNATDSDATVTLIDTAASDVLFHTLNLGNGHTFTMAGNGGYTVNTYNVLGPATFNGNLNAAGSTMNFYLPASMGAGGAMLTVTNGNAHIDGSTITWGFDGASSVLKPGDQIKLIDVGSPGKTLDGTPTSITGRQGVTLEYTFDFEQTGTQLLATVADVSPSDLIKSESLGQGFLSGMGLLNQSSDLIAGWGMAAAIDAAKRPNLDTRYGLGVFGAATVGSSRYQTGSSVDVSGISLMAGVSKRIALQPGNLVVGAFFEYGNGSYDTYSAFHGSGDLDHFGGGIIGRFDFAGSKTGHFYTEGSARVGTIDNDFGNLYFRGQEVRYDASSTYYGIHLASGYIWNLTDKASLDFYARYFWTQQKGDTVRLSTGDSVDFDNINSHRMRVGTRFAYAANASLSPYVGVAYEHEFDGEARATTKGIALKAPSIDGGSGVGELGLTFKPSALPVSLDLGLQGYVGTREGVAGTLHLRYEF